MYYFPVNLFLVFSQGCGYCIIHRGLERQRVVVNFLAADFGRLWFSFSTPEDVACWDPLTGIRGSFANGSRREFLHPNMFSQVSLLTPAVHVSCFWAKEEAWWERSLWGCRARFRAVTAVMHSHTHTPALPAVWVLQHSLWEDPARATACPATHSSKALVPCSDTPFPITTAFQKFFWSGLNLELTRSQWLHWAMEICLKLQMCPNPF